MVYYKPYTEPYKVIKRRVVYFWEYVLLLVMTAVFILFIPMDLTAGWIGTRDLSPEEASQLVTEQTVDETYFEQLFDTGTARAGAYVQQMGREYYAYHQKYRWSTYANIGKQDNLFGILFSPFKPDTPQGLVLENGVVCVQEGKIYIRQRNGEAGIALVEAATLTHTDGKVDYQKVHTILTSASPTYAQAAAIYSLIEQDILVGYSEGVAWFAEKNEDGSANVRKVTADGVEESFSTKAYSIGLAVIENKYMIYDDNGYLHIQHLETDAQRRLAIAENRAIRDFCYGVTQEGSIKIYMYDNTQAAQMTMVEGGVEYINESFTAVNGEEVTGIAVVARQKYCNGYLRCGTSYVEL